MKGRNDPCFCGSGKKYKKCHIPVKEPTWRRLQQQIEQAKAVAATLPKFNGSS